MRAALYQGPNAILNYSKPTWLTAWAWNVAKTRSKKRVTVGLARRFDAVLHRMWRDGTEFRFKRAEAMTDVAA